MNNLQEIIEETAKNGIPIELEYNTVMGCMVYQIKGFSKSGNAAVYYDKDKDTVISETRYNQIDEISSFEDLARVAYDWNKAYIDRIPFGWDFDWKPVFDKFGWETDDKRKKREKICNYCLFAKGPGLPDGIICDEPHHVEAGVRERHQCYSHTCEYFEDDGVKDVYNLSY